MNHDQNKKTLRQFQCRDYLWEIFEQMSAELECSVDYLINESMRQYARSRNYGVRTPGPSQHAPPMPAPRPQPSIPSAPPPPPGRGAGSYPGSFGAPPPSAGYPPPPASPRPSYGAPAQGYGSAPSSYPPPATQRPPAPSGYGAAPAAPPPMPSSPGYPPPQGYAPPPMPHAPPPLPGGSAAPVSAGMSPLFVIFNGQKFPVQKEEFIIGRGTKTADLPIKDGNISRRHAAVIWQNGAWYMKDLGSTNGVEFQGRKVDSRRIEEGDVYQLCDYEVRFTYR